MNLTTEEMDLVTRSLSDSMNYKPNDRFDEKYSLLLHCQRKQSELEKKKKEQKKVTEDVSKENETEADNPERCPWYETAGRVLLI